MNRSSKLSSLLALSVLAFAVLACRTGGSDSSAIPIPEDKKNYIGDWEGQSQNGSMTLSIAPDGTVNYERKEGTTGTSSKYISGGRINKFDGNDFEVKVSFVSTTFKVEKPPYRDGQRWKMVVDGVEVSRKDSGNAESASNSKELTVEVAEMRKDDGNGKMSSEATTTFSQSDKAVHCYIRWRNPKAGTRIKFVFTTVRAGKEESNSITDITKNDEVNAISESLERGEAKALPKGPYKVEIYINEKLERTLHFEIN